MRENTKNNLFYLMFVLGVIFLRVFYITKVKGPFVWTDELAYWGHAANLTGNSWAGVMNGMPWYAFGYSLCLMPLFLFTDQVLLISRLAVFLNVVFSVLIFWLAVRVIRRLSNSSDPFFVGATAFAATSYSALVFQSYITWGETLLSLLAWGILYVMLRLEEEPTPGKSLLLGLLSGYAYMVHNRMIAVIGAVFAMLLILVLIKKLPVKYLFGVFLTLALVFVIYLVLKQELRSLILTDRELQRLGIETMIGKANTLGDQVQKIKSLFTVKGMGLFLKNLTGQIWHFLSASYLAAGFGVLLCVDGLAAIFQKKEERLLSLYLLPLLMLAATMAMTALFFIEAGADSGRVRIDTYFYGRYHDVLVPFFVAAGLCGLRERAEGSRRGRYGVAACAVIYLAASFCVYRQVGQIADFYLNTVSAVSIYTFHWLGNFAVWKCMLMAVCVGVVLLAAAAFGRGRDFREAVYGMLCLMLALLFAATAFSCMRTVIRGENDYIGQQTTLYEYLNENTARGDIVYTLSRGKPAYDLQTRLVDKQVVPIEASMVEQVADGSYLVLSGEDVSLLETIAFESCAETADYAVVRKTGQAAE